MRAQLDRVLVHTPGVVSLLLMPVSDAMADWTTMSGGMMGNGSWHGTGGAWLPALIVIVLGVVLFVALRKKN
jgi:lipopolysaccharide export LptBFGC system permease protein LptF